MSLRFTSRLLLVVLSALAASDPVHADGSFPVPDFQANSTTAQTQTRPAVGVDGSGGFMVVWESYAVDGSSSGIAGRRFDAAVTPQGLEFVVNAYTTGHQSNPSVAAHASGFVVVWTDTAQDGSPPGVFGQRFDSDGTPQGGEFQVNTYTTGTQYTPRVAANSSGDFVVVWAGAGGQDGSLSGVFAQRFDSGGVVVGPEVAVNTFTTAHQRSPSVAIDAAGDFVVVWDSGYSFGAPDGDRTGIFGRRFDSVGVPQGPEFQVNSYTTGYQTRPSVAADPSGSFLVVWEDSRQDPGMSAGVYAQRFDAAGVPTGAEFRVNTYTTGTQILPRVAADAAGNFVVTWASSSHQDGSFSGIFGQRYDPTGAAIGSEFQANTYTLGTQAVPAVAAGPAGPFVVVWQSFQPGAFSEDIFGQRSGCGDGVLQPGEICDDGNVVAGDGCELTCTPTGCGDGAVLGVEQCDDGNIQNGDCCSAACLLEPSGSACPDDGNPCTPDVCSGAGVCEHPPLPATGCRQTQSGRGVFRVRAPDTLVWRWIRGEATVPGDFGDPFTFDEPESDRDGTDYFLCVYDASGPPFAAVAPPGGFCRGNIPCWRTISGDALLYNDRDGDPDGVTQIRLTPGADGKARFLLRAGRGAVLPALPLTPPVRVQLRTQDAACWEATYSSPLSSDGSGFKAKPD